MSDIKAGDLVIVVRQNGCTCRPPQSLGMVFTVAKVAATPRQLHCGCGRPTIVDRNALMAGGACFAISRLKKINPPAETTDTREPVYVEVS